MPMVVAPQSRDATSCDCDRWIPLAFGDLAQHTSQWETSAGIGHPFGRIRFGENAERGGRILDSFHNENRQIRAEFLTRVGRDNRRRQRLLFLRPQPASKHGIKLNLGSLG